ncbi:hypothetical protein BZA70DRAFT_285027 [Myxozyma melibiosi]|uniref:Uncharacterized protein n=1 Tax=Myxozyma melibiosi TaxID=54550 RepID=A0ABR1EZ48_9ASCO
MERKAPRSTFTNSARGTKPYARPATATATPQRAAQRNDESGATPTRTPGGSIFSKIWTMFTPGRNPQQQDGEEETAEDGLESGAVEDETEKSTDEGSTAKPSKLPYLFSPAQPRSYQQFTTPSANPPSPFRFNPEESATPVASRPSRGLESPSASSPTQKLEKFFRIKGNEPLSEIETEGVLALIRQAAEEAQKEQNGNADEKAKTSGSPLATEISQPREQTPPMSVAERLYPSVPTFATPSRRRPLVLESQTVRAPRYNPILTPQRRRAMTPTHIRPREVELPSHSTPFRARTPRATSASTPAISSPSSTSPRALSESKETAGATAAAAVVPAPTPKRISTTASTLLSLISPVGTSQEVAAAIEEDRERVIDPALRPFVNPYAASGTIHRTPKRAKRKESVLGLSASVQRKRTNTSETPVAKRSAIEEIERTMPSEERASVSAFEKAVSTATPVKAPVAESSPLTTLEKIEREPDEVPAAVGVKDTEAKTTTPPPAFSFDKFRPSKSSSLRESVVMSPPQSPTKKEEKKAEEKKTETTEFKVTPLPGFSGPPKITATAAAIPVTAVSKQPEPEVEIERTQEQAKALATMDYKAYVGRFFFYPVQRAEGQQSASEKALEAQELLYSTYKMKYNFTA